MNSNVPKYDFNNKLQTGHESALTDKGIPTYQYTLPPTHPLTKINMLNQTITVDTQVNTDNDNP